MRHLSITVAIPTCYGEKSLLRAAQSIRTSVGAGAFQLLITADSRPLTRSLKMKLKTLAIDVRENKTPGTQMHKVKQMITRTRSDIFVFTQDDVRFDPYTLAKIRHAFATDPKLTLVGTNVLPEPATTFLERVLEVGLRSVLQIGLSWHRGDNYLLANGRCMAFRTKHLRKMLIPEAVVNSDAYLYFENKRQGGKFKFLVTAKVYNQTPQLLGEHIRQSRRFRYSESELVWYFGTEVKNKYAIPEKLKIQALLQELLTQPFYTMVYLGIQLYTRITEKLGNDYKNPLWKINLSTKRV